MFSDLTFEELTKSKDILKKILMFRTTMDIEGSDSLIGQERAENAMEFGISIREKGYNIYISGSSGSGRTYYAKKYLEKICRNYKIPDDWCYVYNFKNKYKPLALNFPPGFGKVFKQDMEYLINEVIDKIPQTFNSEEYDRQKNEILEDYHDLKNKLVDELSSTAESSNLQVKATSNGFAFVPIVDGKPLSEEEYDSMDGAKREEILKSITEMRIKAMEILRRLKNAEKEADKKVKKLENEVGQYIVENIIESIKRKYISKEKVLEYFAQLKDDILENLDTFISGIDKHSTSKEEDELLFRYGVNLIVDNSESHGAPFIYEINPSFNNLMGNIEYESKLGTITTDYLMIRAGAILKANGGFLIVNIDDVLKNYQSWEGLKRVLKSGEITVEGIRSQLDLLTIVTVKPEPIPVNIKVILIGTEEYFHILFELDSEFNNLFKIKADFDIDMEYNEKNILRIAKFICNYCSTNNIRHLESDAVASVIEYCSKITGSSKRLSTCLEKAVDLINEANIWASALGYTYIRRENIKKAISEKKKRVNLIEDRIQRQYENQKYMISVNGKNVGQINGLSVIEMGGYSFGKPYRITASTYMGKNGIINIEREAQMSGNIHSKSVMIISGYLGGKYARSIPLSMTAHICLEQLYGFIDGDSASIAELYAILSSLSGIPFRQGIAVTGSLNQMGEVQPVGGINEKIESFYKVCRYSGLDGSHGVILPHKNIDDIMLDDEIMKDIKANLFHLYGVNSVDDGIQILSGIEAGKRDEHGEFENSTFNYYVDKTLKEFIINYNKVSELKTNEG